MKEATNTVMKATLELGCEQRERLRELAHGGCQDAVAARRARMLLLAEEGYNDREVARVVGVDRITVWRLRKRFAEGGLEAALINYREHMPKKLNADQKTYLMTLARSEPPQGREWWTLGLLAERLAEVGMVEKISHVAVWKVLRSRSGDDSNLRLRRHKRRTIEPSDAGNGAHLSGQRASAHHTR